MAAVRKKGHTKESLRDLHALSLGWYWATDARHRFTTIADVRGVVPAAAGVGRLPWQLPGVGEPENEWARLRRTLARRRRFSEFEYVVRLPGKSERWISASGVPVFDATGRFTGYEGTARFITERKLVEIRLRESEERFRRLTAMAADWYWECDAQWKLTFLSESFRERVGIDPASRIGLDAWPERDEDFEAGARAELMRQVHGRLPFANIEFQRAYPDGRRLWRSMSGEPFCDAAGRFLGYRGTARDITARKHAEEALRRLAQHDALTGLANRTLLRDRLNHAIANARRSGAMLAVMLLDLDHFKEINDSLGHDAGDELLVEIANRLPSCVRAGDTVARLGGDEFVLLFENVDSVEVVASAAARVLDAVALPCSVAARPIATNASLGISLFPRDGEDPNTLLRHADAAMYEAKRAGRGVVRFHSPQSGAAGRGRTQGEPIRR